MELHRKSHFTLISIFSIVLLSLALTTDDAYARGGHHGRHGHHRHGHHGHHGFHGHRGYYHSGWHRGWGGGWGGWGGGYYGVGYHRCWVPAHINRFGRYIPAHRVC